MMASAIAATWPLLEASRTGVLRPCLLDVSVLCRFRQADFKVEELVQVALALGCLGDIAAVAGLVETIEERLKSEPTKAAALSDLSELGQCFAMARKPVPLELAHLIQVPEPKATQGLAVLHPAGRLSTATPSEVQVHIGLPAFAEGVFTWEDFQINEPAEEHGHAAPNQQGGHYQHNEPYHHVCHGHERRLSQVITCPDEEGHNHEYGGGHDRDHGSHSRHGQRSGHAHQRSGAVAGATKEEASSGTTKSRGVQALVLTRCVPRPSPAAEFECYGAAAEAEVEAPAAQAAKKEEEPKQQPEELNSQAPEQQQHEEEEEGGEQAEVTAKRSDPPCLPCPPGPSTASHKGLFGDGEEEANQEEVSCAVCCVQIKNTFLQIPCPDSDDEYYDPSCATCGNPLRLRRSKSCDAPSVSGSMAASPAAPQFARHMHLGDGQAPFSREWAGLPPIDKKTARRSYSKARRPS